MPGENMTAGTITLTNNSDAVAGAGTAFITDLAAGDFIVANVGGIAYTLPVKSIASATALTIINKFTGPTMSGLAWFIAKRDQQAMIPAALGVQNAEALRLLNNDKANWQQVFSAAGDITVTLPDNSQFTGPSWQKIVTLLAQSDIEAIQPLADQVRADAQQVAADLSAAETAATIATGAVTTAGDAAATATQAKADAAASQTAAAASEVSAKADADRAETAAGTIDTTAFLRKDGNLTGLTDKDAARDELGVYSQQEVDDAIANGGSGIPLGFQYHHSNRAKLNAGTVVGDGQIVTIAGSFSDLADHAEENEPLTTEALWQSDPSKRGCYVIDRTAGTMRLPDLNGVQPGSYGPVYKTGDGGTIAAGTITQNAAPDATGNLGGFYGEPTYIGQRSDGVFAIGTGTADKTKGGISTVWNGLGASFALSRGHAAYGRNAATRVKPDSQHGVWVIQYANAARNSGEIDALEIDADLQNFKLLQQAINTETNNRIGYALLDFGTMSNANRKVLANPFGNNTPVILYCEIFVAGLSAWAKTEYIWNASNNLGYGAEAYYSEGEGIVVQTGRTAVAANTGASMGTVVFTTNITTAPIRVHAIKVTR